jgi:hypothetical protein
MLQAGTSKGEHMTKLTRTELLALAKLGAAARLAEIEQERALMVRILNQHGVARQKRRAVVHRANLSKPTPAAHPHWTQRAENRHRLGKMLRKATATRRKNALKKEEK